MVVQRKVFSIWSFGRLRKNAYSKSHPINGPASAICPSKYSEVNENLYWLALRSNK